MNQARTIQGGCHCGNIRFELVWPGSSTEIRARACGCSFCQKHGGRWTSQSNAELLVNVKDTSLVSKYAFGTKTADFHVCARCGVVPFVTSEIQGKTYAVVNVNALTGANQLEILESSTDFEREDTANRLLRRARNWIPSVRINE